MGAINSLRNVLSSKRSNAKRNETAGVKSEAAPEENNNLTRYISGAHNADEVYRNIIECMCDYVAIIDFTGKYLYVSPSHRQMGYEPKDLVGKMAINQIPLEDKMRLLPVLIKYGRRLVSARAQTLDAVRKELSKMRFSFRFPDKSGKWHDIESSVSIVRHTSGKGYAVLLVSRDVTERNKAEQKLRESNIRWGVTFNAVTDLITVQDNDFRILKANKAYADMLKTTPEKLVGKKCYSCGKDGVGCSLPAKAIKSKKPERAECFEPRFGAYFDISVSPIFDESGKLKSFVHIARDITERKKAEIEYKTMLQTAMDSFYVTDKEGRILDVNDSYCNLIGYGRDELLKMKISDVDAVDTPEVIARRIKQIMKTGSSRFETYHKRKDGGTVAIEASVNYANIGEGKFFVFMRDITGRKKMVEDLLKFRLGLERSSDAVFITDIEGTITYVNPAFEKVYGYSKKEATGKTPRIIKSGAIPDEHYKQFWDNLLTKKTVTGEIVNKRKDGNYVPIDGSNNPILDENGNIIGFLAIHRDITERKKAEDEKNKLDRELKAKVGELERFNKLTVGRELKMIELKKRIKEIENNRGEQN